MYLSFVQLGLMIVSFSVNGVTYSSMNASNSLQKPRLNKTPVNNCNCHCTVNQNSRMRSLEAKVEGLVALINSTSGVSYAIKSLEARVESLIGLNNSTSSVSDAVKSLEAKMESLIGMINSTSSFIPQQTPQPTGKQDENY